MRSEREFWLNSGRTFAYLQGFRACRTDLGTAQRSRKRPPAVHQPLIVLDEDVAGAYLDDPAIPVTSLEQVEASLKATGSLESAVRRRTFFVIE